MSRPGYQACLALILLTTIVASESPAQDVEVKGAQVVLQPKPVAVDIITIENRRGSPLVAWEISAGRSTLSTDVSGRPEGAGSDAIAPNERRDIEMERHDDQAQGAAHIRLRLAVFADGYVEGVPDAVERWQQKQQERVDEAAYWVRAFDTMPEYSEDAARQHFAARTAERAARASGESSVIGDRLARLVREPPQAPGRLFASLEMVRRDAQARHAAVAPRARTAPRLEAGTPVVVSSRRATLTQFVAAVKNLRDVPIEALGLEFVEPGAARPASGQLTDYCMVIGPSSRGNGRIAPGETRELTLSRTYRDGSRLPAARISVVLFDDLTFEGSAARRDELLRSRELQAEDIAFAIALRSEAVKKRPEDLLAFLVATRADRAKHLHAQGRSVNLHLIDQLIEQAKVSPEALRNTAPVEHLEVQRQALLRHRKQEP